MVFWVVPPPAPQFPKIRLKSFPGAKSCPDFMVDGTKEGSWRNNSTGMSVTVECLKNHVLKGAATLTCQSDGTWSSEVPTCEEVGKIIDE